MRKRKAKDRNDSESIKSLASVTNATVTVSDEAAEKLKEALEQSSSAGIRIRTTEAESNRFAFSLNVEEEVGPNDLVVEEKEIKFIIGKSTAQDMREIEIGFVKTAQGSGFTVRNPAYG